jgi:hypothetical protein
MHINLLGYHPQIDEEFSEDAFKSAIESHGRFFEAVDLRSKSGQSEKRPGIL